MKFKNKVLFPIFLIFTLIISLTNVSPAAAQSTSMTYTVLQGDTVDSIAQAFHTTAYRIRYLNYLSDADYIYPGQRLVIPGFQDVQGEAIKVVFPYGQSLSSYFASLRQPLDLLNRLNFITNPDQTWAGQPLYIMYTDQPAVREVQVTGSLTGLELAVKQGVSNWAAPEYNQLDGPWDLIPNTSLWLPDNTASSGVQGETQPKLQIKSEALYQGKTSEWIAASPPLGATLSGNLDLMINDSLGQSSDYTPATYPLHFFATDDGKMTALQGIHRFAKPGLAPFTLTTTYADGSMFAIQQNALVKSFDYGLDAEINVESSYIDPAVTVPEWQLVKSYIQNAPPEKYWTNGFQDPDPTATDWISSYGRLRSYNGSDFIYFHSGIDMPGSTTTTVYAAAAGEVVYTGTLEVRGNATIISHGRGVYTAYYHQSKINVKVGDHVEASQPIGMVGNTGRVTGAHLHFEVFVGGVQVDPTEWLQGAY